MKSNRLRSERSPIDGPESDRTRPGWWFRPGPVKATVDGSFPRAPRFDWSTHASSLRSLDTTRRSWYDSVRPWRSFTYLSQVSISRSVPMSGHGDTRLRVWPVGFLHRVSHLEPQRFAHRRNGSDPSLPGDGGTRAVASAFASGRPCAIP